MDEINEIEENNPTGFDTLAQDGRWDARMRKNNLPYTEEQGKELIREIKANRINRRLRMIDLSQQLGIALATLSEIMAGTYKGNVQRFLRKIDDFLAEQRRRDKKLPVGEYQETDIMLKMDAVVNTAIANRSMAIIMAPPGVGKTMYQNAKALDRESTYCIRIDQVNGGKRGVLILLCKAFRLDTFGTSRELLSRIDDFLKKNRMVVVLVDEAQNLRPDGIEIMRDIFDMSDPTGRWAVPIIFFGDERFHKLLTRARAGEPSALSPQFSRRVCPVLDVRRHCSGDGGSDIYSEADIARILGNARLRVVDEKGIRWLKALANTEGYGAVGFAVAIARMAYDIAPSIPMSLRDLQTALQMAIGPRAVRSIDESAGGALLAAAG